MTVILIVIVLLMAITIVCSVIANYMAPGVFLLYMLYGTLITTALVVFLCGFYDIF